MSFPVKTTPEAERQIREVHAWWIKNRPAAPDLFLQELSEQLEIVAESPLIGRLYWICSPTHKEEPIAMHRSDEWRIGHHRVENNSSRQGGHPGAPNDAARFH